MTVAPTTVIDRLHERDPDLAAGVTALLGLVRGRHVYAGWKFGNFMDDPAERVTVEPAPGERKADR